ncbi:lipoprotein signal peptidase [Muribaculaceae bacterium Isolate-104 (HZI)]|jgi:signal peptidase II|nr:lipoprotein signal peptidase [Muribaculaceae bacterium Isolate-104 (HZI)]
MKSHKGLLATGVILLVVILDQILKIWVKTGFYLGEDYRIFDWFQLVFVQNNGMAFGMEMGSKLFLTLFRIVAVGVLIWIIARLRNRPWVSCGFMVCIALITAGAAGNIIDCVFYGLIFNNPMPPEVAVMFPEGGGYAPVFHGMVVDMFYFPLFSFNWPEWVPWVGGENFLFFQPVFNLADAAISVGMIVLILFYGKQLSADHQAQETE